MTVRYEPQSCDTPADGFLRRFCGLYLEAWNSHVPDRVLALATEDVLWEDPTIPGGRARGHAEVRSWLVSFWRAFPDMTFAFLDGASHEQPDALYVSGCGRRVAAPWRCHGTLLGPLDPPGFAPTGRKLELAGVDLYAFRGGRVCHVRTITDLQDAARQAGLLPRAGGAGERIAVLLQRMRARLR